MLPFFPRTLATSVIVPVALLIIFFISGSIGQWLQVHNFGLFECLVAFISTFGLQVGFFRHVYLVAFAALSGN